MNGLDEASYKYYYQQGLSVLFSKLKMSVDGIIISEEAEKQIWNEYAGFNEHCKIHYMKNDRKLLDCHKVTACYMYAIEKAHVISVMPSIQKGDDTNLLLNEKVSFTFGMSVLRTLILGIADELADSEVKDKINKVFAGDMLLPMCTHGDYKSNLLSQLFYTWKEGNYNILALAETLYMIECYNLIRAGIPEDCLKLANLQVSTENNN